MRMHIALRATDGGYPVRSVDETWWITQRSWLQAVSCICLSIWPMPPQSRPSRTASRLVRIIIISSTSVVGMAAYILLGEVNLGRRRTERSKDPDQTFAESSYPTQNHKALLRNFRSGSTTFAPRFDQLLSPSREPSDPATKFLGID